MKRIIATILVVVLAFGCLSSCANTSASEKNMIKGEFFSLIMSEMNLYPIDATWEEMENSNNYDIEADSIVKWGILPEEIAKKGLYSAVDKETVVLACLNSIFFKQTGNIDDIEDAKLCKYPQEMADAVATGIIELDKNNCINGKEKMSVEDCKAIIDTTLRCEANGHFKEGEGSFGYDFGENSVVITQDDLQGNDRIIVEKSTIVKTEELSAETKAEATTLSFNNASIAAETLANDETVIQTVKIPISVFEDKMDSPKIGTIIVYDANLQQGNVYKENQQVKVNSSDSFAGKIKSIKKDSVNKYYICELYSLPDEEIMANTEANGITSTAKKDQVKYKQLSTEIDGFKIAVGYDNKNGGAISVDVEKTLTLKTEKYGNWRDAETHPEIKLHASIGNFQTDIDGIKYLFKKTDSTKETSVAKITYDMNKEFSLTDSARFVPDSNYNRNALQSIKNSRFTDGAGAKSIKIAKLDVIIPNTGITVVFYVLLNISLDGRIDISISNNACGFEVYKKNGNVSVREIEGSKTQKTEIESKLSVGLELETTLNFTLVKNVIVYGVSLICDIDAVIKTYYESKPLDSSSAHPDIAKAADIADVDEKCGYSLDANIKIRITGNLKEQGTISKGKCLLYKVLGSSKAAKLSFEGILLNQPYHIEKNINLSEVSDTTNNDQLAVSEKKFYLESSKLNMTDGTCNSIKITGMPISSEKIDKNYANGIQVRVKNSEIAEATYVPDGSCIIVSANKPGSTEIEVYVMKDKRTGKEYVQTFSVTISENHDLSYQSFSIDEDLLLNKSNSLYA